jgi:hypothetical protein
VQDSPSDKPTFLRDMIDLFSDALRQSYVPILILGSAVLVSLVTTFGVGVLLLVVGPMVRPPEVYGQNDRIAYWVASVTIPLVFFSSFALACVAGWWIVKRKRR